MELNNFYIGFLFFIVGTCFGSFINVLIYRLPIQILQNNKSISLNTKSSFCPNCKEKILWFYNIPLLGFIFTKGKCSFCLKKINFSYFLIELFTGIVFLTNFLFFKDIQIAIFINIFYIFAIPLIIIDIKYLILPDCLTFCLLILGIFCNYNGNFSGGLIPSILGAAIAYLIFWSIYKIFLIIRKKEGMGQGDIKLIAAMGAWCGYLEILNIITISALIGLFFSLYFKYIKKQEDGKIPFGPFLIVSSILILYFKN